MRFANRSLFKKNIILDFNILILKSLCLIKDIFTFY
jgi:hypothetical protein